MTPDSAVKDAVSAEQSNKETVRPPLWEGAMVDVQTDGGPKSVAALVHEWVPGLAVTMTNFGLFSVTHIATGFKVGGIYERAGSAVCEAAEWGAIAVVAGFAWTQPAEEIVAALNAAGDMPVPFPNATTTGGGVTKPMTIMGWTMMTRTTLAGDEFPWESESDDPWTHAGKAMLAIAAAKATGGTHA